MGTRPSPVQRLRTRALARPRLAASIGLWTATVCGFLAIGAVLPVLPRYVRGPVGAGDLAVGVVIGCFAFAAVVGRPVGGRLADEHGRKLILVTGLVIAGAAGALYLLPLGVPGLIVARLVLGVGDGWVFTAGATWIVDLAPEERRGQAIGLFGLAIWGGLAGGPIIGEVLLHAFSYDAVWIFAAVAPLIGALIALRLPEDHTPPPARALGAAREPLVPRPVVPPGIALALANVGYGAMAAFVVLHLEERGVAGGATVFTAFAASVVISRLVAGTLPDRLGPRVTATAAAMAEAAGLALIAVASSFGVALAGAIIMGAGFSLLFPSLALIAVSRVGDVRRGAALGVFTAFFDAGVGIGAPLAGAIAATSSYQAAFWASAGAALASAAVARGLQTGFRKTLL
ncbi:MAG: transporter [Solirubrobacterales bacterium]|nr:transporter [Solirubrobacterales bacterium]